MPSSARYRRPRKRAALLLVVMLGVSLGFYTSGAVPVAHADSYCSDQIPVDALAGSVFKSAASGALVTAAGIDSGAAAVALGGAAPVAATGLLGTVGLATATFFAAVLGTCKFLDWAVNEFREVLPMPDIVGVGAVTVSSVQLCTDFDVRMTAATKCVAVSRTDGTNFVPTGYSWEFVSDASSTTLTDGSLTIPATTFGSVAPSYPESPWSVAGVGYYLPISNSYCSYSNTTAACASAANIGNRVIFTIPSNCSPNIGDACSTAPGRFYYGRQDRLGAGGPDESVSITPIFNLFPNVKLKGWKRYLDTQVLCSTTGWIRALSDYYYDKEVTARLEAPSCPTGERIMQWRTFRVPSNVSCSLGSATCSNALLTFEWTAPTVWTTAPPSFLPCLAAGNTCGSPELVSGVCVWGGITVATSFCDPERQSGTSTAPGTKPTGVGVLTTPNPSTNGEPTSTETPDGGPSPDPVDPPTGEPPSVNVNVHIDDDGESSRRPRVGDEGGDCWPTGWGWFNPFQWVYRPVVCALTFLFIPDESVVDDFIADANELAEHAPISYLTTVYVTVEDFLTDTPAAIAAARDDCIEIYPAGPDNPVGEMGYCPSDLAEHVSFEGWREKLGLIAWFGFAWSLWISTRRVLAA